MIEIRNTIILRETVFSELGVEAPSLECGVWAGCTRPRCGVKGNSRRRSLDRRPWLQGSPF
jgi:hypothetical protein